MQGTGLPLSFRTVFLLGTLVLIGGLGSLACAVLWLETSSQRFGARADMARQQALLVVRLEAEAAHVMLQPEIRPGKTDQGLNRVAREYMTSIARETTLLDAGPEARSRQIAEAQAGRELLGAIRHSASLGDIGHVRSLARAIAAKENREAEEAAIAARRTARATWWLICAVMAVLLALPVGFALLLWHNLIQPLKRLASATDLVADGAAPIRLRSEGLREIRSLIIHFNNMAGAVESRVTMRTAQLQDAHDRLAETDRRRRLFLSKVSHELRTPVTVMRGEAEIALRIPGNEDSLREALRRILDSNMFLQRRLDDLLSLARAEDGALPLSRARLDLSGIVRQAGQTATAFAATSGVSVEMIGLDEVMPVQGDEDRIRQALVALIDNGVKFSPAGGRVRLTATRAGRHFSVTVSDQGPGVETGDLCRIFDPYVQGDAGRALGGTGLGLSLARWIAQAHDGSIVAAHNAEHQGEGLCVSMILPVAA